MNFEFGAPRLERIFGELLAIVRDNSSWYAKLVDYVAPYEFKYLIAYDIHQWLGLDPFSKIVYSNYSKLGLSRVREKCPTTSILHSVTARFPV